jgi:hypothetical protein
MANNTMNLDITTELMVATSSPLEKLLNYSTNGDFDNAKLMMEHVKNLLPKNAIARKIENIANNNECISYVAPFYIVGDYSAQLVDKCHEAMEFLKLQGVELNMTLLIDANIKHKEFAAAVALTSDVFYLCVSSRDELQFYASLVHEFTHAVFKSGNRFLDEAAAYYFELKSKNEFPQKAEKETLIFQSSFIDILTLISYEGSDDPFFDKLLPGSGFSIHALGSLFFHYLIEEKGIDNILSLYIHLQSEPSNFMRIQHLNNWLGIDIHSIRNLFPAPATGYIPRSEGPSMSYENVEFDFVLGYLSKLRESYDEIFIRQKANTEYPILIRNEAEILVLATVSIERAFESKLTRCEFAFCKAHIDNFLLEKGNDWPRYNLFSAMTSLLTLPFEASMLDAILLIDEVKVKLSNGLADSPGDPVYLVFLSRLIWLSPSETSEDKQEAIDLLEILQVHALYGEKITQLINDMKLQLGEEC